MVQGDKAGSKRVREGEKPKAVKVTRHEGAGGNVESKRKTDLNEIPPLRQRAKTTQVFIFGTGEQAELGLGQDMLLRKKPMPIKALSNEKIVEVYTGGQHCIVLTEQGKLWSWGTSDSFALGRITTENFSDFSKAMPAEAGKLSPEEIKTEWEPAPIDSKYFDNLRIVKVACGDCVTVVLTEKGTIYQCGVFRGGEGNIKGSRRLLFELVKELKSHCITDIACGNNHVLAVTTKGYVFAWGNGEQMQFGRRSSERRFVSQNRLLSGTRPERVPISRIISVGVGGYHSFAIDADEGLWVWGMNNYGQCFAGPSADARISQPLHVMQGLKVAKAVGGDHFSLLLAKDENDPKIYRVWTCGRSDSGQLGLPTDVLAKNQETNESTKTSAVLQPQKLGLADIKDIDAGSEHCIAVSIDGKAYCWGFGGQHQLGTSSEDDVFEPELLTGQKLEGWLVRQGCVAGGHSLVLAEFQE